MKRVTVTELKNGLSQYLRMVKRGATLEVVERSIPIARITAASPAEGASDERLERLIYEGVITRARRPPGAKPMQFKPVPCRADAVQALIDGRGDR
jgi:prevent-host-death family protein